MTLDEAIKYFEEKAKELSDKAYEEWGKTMTEEQAYACNECAREYEQLAKWLKELRRQRMNNDFISRKALKKELDNIKQTEYAIKDKQPLFEYVELSDLIKTIDNAPTVDFEKLGKGGKT